MTPSDRDAVQFTRESAERIANVVRAAELTPRGGRPLSFEPLAMASGRKAFRMATFTGAWSIGSEKTVTLRGSTATLSATNPFLSLPENGSRVCGVARDGAAWYLVQWQQDVTDALSGAYLGAAALEFQRVRVASLATASTVRITTTTCA